GALPVPVGAPSAPAAPPSAPAASRGWAPTARFATPEPDVLPAAGAPEVPADETGGIGGLFGGGGHDPGPAAPGWAPAAPPPEPSVLPVDGPADPPVPLVGPRRRSPAVRRRLALLVAGALALLVGVVGTVVGLTGDDDSASATPEQPTSVSASPAAQVPPGPQPGQRTVLDGTTFVLQQVRTEGTCTGNAYGAVADFFERRDCAGLSRVLYATDVAGRAAVVSVVAVDMGDPAGAGALRALADRDGSGNVSDLLREGARYAGGPAELSGAEYASAVEGSVVTIVETAWAAPGGTGTSADLDLVAGTALALPMPAPAGG
ncbi:hypothetical protein ABQ292_03765, partial [Geodermatophilus sp. WL48A]